jgi:spermidine synthase
VAWFFVFFFISGCCSIIYEIVWLRLAIAQFGVTTALTSIMLAAFMAGLGLGSWASGRLTRRYGTRISFPPLRLYALTELLIGASALLVPIELRLGRRVFEKISFSSSISYYVACGLWIALTLIPWCALMGATIPVAMFAIRRVFQNESSRSFSFLYLANVLGAVLGTIVPLILVELYGFHGTLWMGATLNVFLAACATALTFGGKFGGHEFDKLDPSLGVRVPGTASSRGIPLLLLFLTGLTSIAIEVVWIRQFTPFLGTMVYTFAFILASYLAATFIGSQVYRIWSRRQQTEGKLIWVLLGFSILLPLITADPAIHIVPLPAGDWLTKVIHIPPTVTLEGNKVGVLQLILGLYPFYGRVLRLILGICPYSGIVGFITPMLVDRFSGGDPDRAGSAYAVNIAGCILGPLLSGFVLLPLMPERWVLYVFALPWLIIGMIPRWSSTGERLEVRVGWPKQLPNVLAFLALLLILTSKGYEDYFWPHVVLRDNTATVLATGEGMTKRLLVNGVGITVMDPITKVMAHLTLASLDYTPTRALVICFGMGTTYRSLLSWNIPTTAVELVPSVPKVFWYYHPDAPQLLGSSLSHVVIDDGRRYLERTSEQYDVINLDPPPPVHAAGSSLLYSSEFYATAKRRLRSGGILQQWLPEDETMGDPIVPASVAIALKNSFVNVRVFHTITRISPVRLSQVKGLLFLASDAPLPVRSAASLAQRMPATAIHDLLEWGPETTPGKQLAGIVDNEVPIQTVIAHAPQAAALVDDRPVNEYYILRLLRRSQTRLHVAPVLGRT